MATIYKEGESPAKYRIKCKKCGTIYDIDSYELVHYTGMDDEKCVSMTCPYCGYEAVFLEDSLPTNESKTDDTSVIKQPNDNPNVENTSTNTNQNKEDNMFTYVIDDGTSTNTNVNIVNNKKYYNILIVANIITIILQLIIIFLNS